MPLVTLVSEYELLFTKNCLNNQKQK